MKIFKKKVIMYISGEFNAHFGYGMHPHSLSVISSDLGKRTMTYFFTEQFASVWRAVILEPYKCYPVK